MRGSVVKRGSKWSVVVDLGRDTTTGRRRQKWHSGYGTRKEAERARTEILGRLDQGTYIEPASITFGEFLVNWIEGMRHRVRPTTWSAYERGLRCHVVPHLGSEPLQRVTAAQLNQLYTTLLITGHARGGGLSPKSVRNVHVGIHRALHDAVRWNLVPRNVADLADPPRHASPEMSTWSAAELRTFLTRAEGHRLYGAFVLAATTGMRRAEVLGLRWRDVNLANASLGVAQTLTTVSNEPILSEPKTARSRRSIALDPTTVTALKDHRRRQAEEKLLMGPAYADADLVFAQPDGALLHPDVMSRQFKALVKSAKLRRIRLHDLRHTHATLALAAGIHPKVVSERLGHATVSITLDVYSHAIPAMQAEAANKIAALIFDAG
jgi:integrase